MSARTTMFVNTTNSMITAARELSVVLRTIDPLVEQNHPAWQRLIAAQDAVAAARVEVQALLAPEVPTE